MPTNLDRSIYATVAWFSLFEYPPTVFEIWKFLWKPEAEVKLEEVCDALEKSTWLHDRIFEDNGFWSLKSAKITATRRHERFLDALRKYKKLRAALRYLSLIPTVRAVAAVNTLSFWHTRPESDIDLLVIARPGTVWLTRLFVVAPFAILKWRPNERARDPFCFSFFVSEDALGLEHLGLPGGDPYLAMWVKSVVPVLDRGGIFARFSEQNSWSSLIFPHVFFPALYTRIIFDRPKRRGIVFPWSGLSPASAEKQYHVAWVSCVLKFFETLARHVQERRLPKQIADLANKDSRVVLSESMLKFHENDRREEFRSRFEALMSV